MKNVIDLNASSADQWVDQNSSLDPKTIDFFKFIVDRAGKSAVSIVNSCAMDDSPYWRAMFEVGMVDAISEDPLLEAEFLGRMCAKPGLPHAHKLVDAYFKGMPADRKEKLFSIPGLKKRGHYFSVCFYGASFNNSCGAHLLNVLKVMISHGMPLQLIMDRNYAELERAALLGHVEFLRAVAQPGIRFPDELLQAIVQRTAKDGKDIEMLSMMIDVCGISIDQMLGGKVIELATLRARSYLNARRVRARRVPETLVDPEDEDFLETM